MGVQAWITLGTVVFLMAVLVLTTIPADVVLLGGLTLLLVLGIVSPTQALAGLSNEGMVTVGVLFVVVAGMRQTGGVGAIARLIWGRPKTLAGAQFRLMAPVAILSAFLNNTPVVAMLVPAVGDWAKRINLSVSKLMIPMSYAAILGGTCTLIGTSTNLIINGLVIDSGQTGLNMFDLAKVGLPCALIGLVYLLCCSRWLLPDRKPVLSKLDDPREYTVEMVIESTSPLVGKTIEQAGLRHLPGMYLGEIDRGGRTLVAVSPQELLHANDRLVFIGIVESVVDLQKIRGLKPATDQVFKLDSPRAKRCLMEAVVSDSCRLVGLSIRAGQFRSVYNAVVIAVARNGERIRKKVGDIILRAGDTLLLETSPDFEEQQRNSRDFFLVSQIEDSSPPRHERVLIAMLILSAMVLVVSFQWLSMLKAAMLAAGLMIITRCCSATVARRSVDWQVLVVIAAAFGIGQALDASGAARGVADFLASYAGDNPRVNLAIVYGITMLFTEMITNNAAAVLVFPIAMAMARNLNLDTMPFIVTVMMAASASFSTPIGYQTNLMVYGPGGYRFTDYLRIGLPLNLIVWITVVTITPYFWPFTG